MKNLLSQLVKFGMIGVVDTLIDYGVFNLLVVFSGVHSPLMVALFNCFSVILANTNSYFMNRYWTFEVRSGSEKQHVSRFIVATGLGIAINTVVITLVSNLTVFTPLPAILILNGGKMAGGLLASLFKFISYRNWVFKYREPIVPFSPEDHHTGLFSVIIPAYNEEKRLPARIEDLARSLPSLFPVELIVVDDGSTDGTPKILQEMIYKYPVLRCCSGPHQGKGGAVRQGMQTARGEFLIFTDADHSFTASHIAAVASELALGRSVVIGARGTDNRPRAAGESAWRTWCGRVFNLLVQALVIPGIKDSQCGLKGFNREVIPDLFGRQMLTGFAFDVELLALARQLNFEIAEIPVMIEDCPGSRVSRIITPLQMGWDLVRLKLALLFNIYGFPRDYQWVRQVGFVLALFLLALAVRLPWLWEVPRFIDELKEVNLAYLIYAGQALPLHNVAHDIGALHNYILAGWFKILGPNIYWPRLYVVLTSALSVVLTFYIGRQLFGQAVGIVAAGLLLTNGMNMLVSHMAWSNSTTPLFFLLALSATITAEQKSSGKWLVIAGFLWALALQTHSSVIIYVLAMTGYVLRPSFRKLGIPIKFYALAVLAFMVGYSNMIYYNIVSRGGSFRWVGVKNYALETQPGITSYFQNLEGMMVELVRSVGSAYQNTEHFLSNLSNPLFLLSMFLILIGGYLAIKKRNTILLWIIASGFIVIPWINHRYVFFLATRYIMPEIICTLLLVALGLVTIYQYLNYRWNWSMGLPVALTGFIIAIGLQVIPYYNYCSGLDGTNASNRMTLSIIEKIDHLSNQKTLVLIDRQLPIENSPLPYVFTLRHHAYQLFNETQTVLDEKHPGQNLVAIVTEKNYLRLKSKVQPGQVEQFSCKITIPAATSQKRTIYLVRIPEPAVAASP